MTKDEKFAKTRKLVDTVVEPKVTRMVQVLNNTLAQFGMRAGVEMQWFFEEIKDAKALEISSRGTGSPHSDSNR